ncbi:hypothetical protein ABZ357_36195 [Streptomyces sp. NPDC005917]|uniref:hypothetical protein n=1 Tax=unclassified Streptomyces TaxID=2593676 RepID=UPI0034051DA0
MNSPIAQRETVRDIEAICRLDLGSRELRRRIADRLLRLVPADSYCFGTIDPATLLITDDVSVGLTPEAAAAAAHNEYLVDDVLKFAALAHSEVSAGTLSAATGGDPQSSHRYRAVLPMIDARHELRAGFVADGRCWGAIALFRGGGGPTSPRQPSAFCDGCPPRSVRPCAAPPAGHPATPLRARPRRVCSCSIRTCGCSRRTRPRNSGGTSWHRWGRNCRSRSWRSPRG